MSKVGKSAEHSGESTCTSPLTNRKTSGLNLTKLHMRILPLGSQSTLRPVLRRLWAARFCAGTLRYGEQQTHTTVNLRPVLFSDTGLELAVVCAQRSCNRMRRLIQSLSVVQRKSLSSFYHSSLSSLFSLPFCCFLSHFQPPIIPSLPHLLALLPHPCPMCPPSSSHLRLSVCRLPICMSVFWLCGRHPVRTCCAHAHVCLFQPACQPVSEWWWRRPAWLKCVFCVIFCSSVLLSCSRLAVVGKEGEKKKQNQKYPKWIL